MCNHGVHLLARSLLSDIQQRDIQDLTSNAPEISQVKQMDDGDVVIYRGTIITMASGRFNPVASMAVKGDTIVAAGTEDEVKAAISPQTFSERDLGSQCIMPGFIEPHLHLLDTALVSDMVDLTYPNVADVTHALNTITSAAKKAGKGKWVVAFGYDPSLAASHDDLSLDNLDQAAPDNPVYVINPSGHLAYVNSAAFNKADIGIEEGDDGYPGGDPDYVKDSTKKKLNGVLLENAVQKLASYLPKFPEANIVSLSRKSMRSWAQAGCTTVFDCGIGMVLGVGDVALLNLVLAPDGRRLPRFRGALAIQAVKDVIKYAEDFPQPPYTVGAVTFYSIKFWLDGSTQGFTAALNTPYPGTSPMQDTAPRGILNYRKDETNLDSEADDAQVQDLMSEAITAGWQMVLHTNGDRAVDQALRVLAGFGSPQRYMHRLEHVTADISAVQREKAAELGLGVSHLMAHVRRWGQAFSDYVFRGQPDRAQNIDAVRDDIAQGLTYSFHSDSFVSPVQPLQYADTAVTRQMDGGGVLGPDQTVTLEEALCGITYNPAKQLGALDEIGTLEVGKKADFVVLSVDPRNVPDGQLHSQCQVVETWIGGELFE